MTVLVALSDVVELETDLRLLKEITAESDTDPKRIIRAPLNVSLKEAVMQPVSIVNYYSMDGEPVVSTSLDLSASG